jgi:hypothetical protein
MGEAFGGGVGAVGGGEGVVDIEDRPSGHDADQLRDLLLLAGMEAGVFEDRDVARLTCRRCSRRQSRPGSPPT